MGMLEPQFALSAMNRDAPLTGPIPFSGLWLTRYLSMLLMHGAYGSALAFEKEGNSETLGRWNKLLSVRFIF